MSNKSSQSQNQPVNPKLRTSKDVYDRLRWSNQFDLTQIMIGYQDRFIGNREISFNKFDPVNGDIPWHRVYYFRTGGQANNQSIDQSISDAKKQPISMKQWPKNSFVLWDRDSRVDHVFNSGVTSIEQSDKKSKRSKRKQQSNNQSNDQSINQSPIEWPEIACPPDYIEIPSFSFNQTSSQWEPHSINQSIYQSNNQTTDQSIDQSIELSRDKAIDQSEFTVLSWNVLDDLKESGDITLLRWQALIDYIQSVNQSIKQSNIQSSNPSNNPSIDLICLQEVTVDFLSVLLKQSWVKEYYISDSTGSINQSNNQSINQTMNRSISPYGQLLLSKFPIHRLFHQSLHGKRSLIAVYKVDQSNNQSINQRFLYVPVVHFTSNAGGDGSSKRSSQLQSIVDVCPLSIKQSIKRSINQSNDQSNDVPVDCLVAGDFNMQLSETHQSVNHFIDCWSYLHPNNQSINQSDNQTNDHGITFDPLINQLAKRLSRSGQPNRYDRMLIRNQSMDQAINQPNNQSNDQSINQPQWLPTSIKIVGKDPVWIRSTDQSTNQSVNQLIDLSDHYGLLTRFKFVSDQSIDHSNTQSINEPSDESIDRSNNQSIDQSSDQHTWRCMERGVVTSALCLLPPDHLIHQSTNQSIDQSNDQSVDQLSLWSLVQSMRSVYDRAFDRWPPHINLIWPFVPFDQPANQPNNQSNNQSILSIIESICATIEPFNVTINRTVNSFDHGKSSTIFLEPISESIKQANDQSNEQSNNQSINYLQARLQAVFPMCQARDHFIPHMTIGQTGFSRSINQSINQPNAPTIQSKGSSKSAISAAWNDRLTEFESKINPLIDSSRSVNYPIDQSINQSIDQSTSKSVTQSVTQSILTFPVTHVHILSRTKDNPFRIIHSIPLGRQPINQTINQSINQSDISSSYKEWRADADRSTDQSIKPTIDRSVKTSMEWNENWRLTSDGVIDLSINQPINQPINHSERALIDYLASHARIMTSDQSINRSRVIHLIKQSIDQFISNLLVNSKNQANNHSISRVFLVGSSAFGIDFYDSDIDLVMIVPLLYRSLNLAASNLLTDLPLRDQVFHLLRAHLEHEQAINQSIDHQSNSRAIIQSITVVTDAIVPVVRVFLQHNQSVSQSNSQSTSLFQIDIACAISANDPSYNQSNNQSVNQCNNHSVKFDEQELIVLDEPSVRSIRSVLDTQAIKSIVTKLPLPSPRLQFTIAALSVKHWTINQSVNQSNYGFLGGFSWLILVLHALQASSRSSSPSSNQSIDQLIWSVFSHLASWSVKQSITVDQSTNQPLRLSSRKQRFFPIILSPSIDQSINRCSNQPSSQNVEPSINTARNLTRSTWSFMRRLFRKVASINQLTDAIPSTEGPPSYHESVDQKSDQSNNQSVVPNNESIAQSINRLIDVLDEKLDPKSLGYPCIVQLSVNLSNNRSVNSLDDQSASTSASTSNNDLNSKPNIDPSADQLSDLLGSRLVGLIILLEKEGLFAHAWHDAIMSNDQSENQSGKQIVCVGVCEQAPWDDNRSATQPIKQPSNQTVTQPVAQSVNQSIDQSINESISLPRLHNAINRAVREFLKQNPRLSGVHFKTVDSLLD